MAGERVQQRAGKPRIGRPPSVHLDDILDAAEWLGLDDLTSTAVAAKLGVSEGTIRNHATSVDHLYSLVSARIFERLEISVPGADHWRDYLTVMCRRIAQLVRSHPGIESYIAHGPYADSTMVLFDRILNEIRERSPDLTAETAWLLGSRAVIMTASTVGVRSTRYPEGVEPDERHDAVFEWMLKAYLIGAEALVATGEVPQFEPTSQQDWARLADASASADDT